MEATVIEVPEAEAALLERTARSVTTAGATLSGSERRQLAQLSRSAADRRGGPDELDPPSSSEPLAEMAHRMTVSPATIREPWVRELERAGVPATTYVEVLGLVSRLTAVDTFAAALGIEPADLPEAGPDQPTDRVADDAALDGGWVPTVGPAIPPTALSLVPDEHEAMHDLHGVFYLSIPDMADLDADRGLHRTQMELVAARTSLLNECFF